MCPPQAIVITVAKAAKRDASARRESPIGIGMTAAPSVVACRQPRYLETIQRSRDRRLCVPALRRVCPCVTRAVMRAISRMCKCLHAPTTTCCERKTMLARRFPSKTKPPFKLLSLPGCDIAARSSTSGCWPCSNVRGFYEQPLRELVGIRGHAPGGSFKDLRAAAA
jgi:hypothetical protein